MALAREVRDVFEKTDGVVDVDWYVESARPRQRLAVDTRQGGARPACGGGGDGRGPDGGRRRAGGAAARPACRASRCRCCCGCRARSAARIEALPALRLGGGGSIGELVRVECRRRGAEHLSQEPAAGDLRHRRRGRHHREPRLRDSPDEPRARERAGCRTATGSRSSTPSQPFDTLEVRDEVGRRVAHHLRGVPRPRHRLRRGAGPHLHPGGRLVPVVRHADDHHAGDSVLAGGHPAGPRRRSAPSSRRRR